MALTVIEEVEATIGEVAGARQFDLDGVKSADLIGIRNQEVLALFAEVVVQEILQFLEFLLPQVVH